jgi:hypothetical protein
MSLSLLIAINVLADVALIAGLAYAMSRAARLTPHVASIAEADARTTPGRSPASPRSRPAGRSSGAQTARGRTPVVQHTVPRTTAAANADR